jgi:D-alanyl-D-alanine carboxypeptidase/D-alanyl-D-alanine-endopeptidase (penicillin-binding protein 4)
MRRLALALLVAAGLLAAPAAEAQPTPDSVLQSSLARAMRGAGRSSGAYVLDATSGKALFRARSSTPRILASNAKLFTSSAVLAKLGTGGTLATTLESNGTVDAATGTLTGDVYLHGGGDPTFGTRAYVRRFYGGNGATVEALADALAATGVTQIRGRIVGDESRFDSLRGVPSSHFGLSSDVGPLSALALNEGRASGGNPPLFTARRLTSALESGRIRVTRSASTGVAPPDARTLASVSSPTAAELVKLMNKPSDNFFAETLLKDLAAADGGRGTTLGGAARATAFARSLGARVRMNDGSGLSRADRASPRQVVKLLDAMRPRPEFLALLDSLPIAGLDGTLDHRLRHGPAHRRCQAKTGTLSNVSTLSGYCSSRGGDLIEFSILMNAVGVTGARRIQDRMATAMAAYDG